MSYNSSTYAHDEQKRVQRAVRHPEHHYYQHFERQVEQNGTRNTYMPVQAGDVASSVALLGNAVLRARGNEHVRVAVMQRMQSAYGNRATRQFVQRASHSHSTPIPIQRGLFGWLRKKFGKLVGKGRGKSRRRETPPPAPEAPGQTGSHYQAVPGQTAGQPQPQPEATTAGGATTPALPAGTPSTLGVTTTDAAQAVNMAQKQVVKYRLLKSVYPDPEHQGEEQQSLIAANLYEKRLENLDNLTNQIDQVQQAMEQARSQGDQQRAQQLEQYYNQLWDNWDFYNQELRQWLWKHGIDPNKIYEYKVKYIRDESEREEFELKGGAPIKQGKPPNERVYDTSGDFSVFSGMGWAIYVMAPDGKIYAHTHKISRFHHSSFLAGGDVAGAGEIKVNNGRLTGITNKSGHYRPGPEYLVQVLKEFRERGANLSGVYLKVFFTDAQGNVHTDDSRDAQKFLQDAEQWMAQQAGAGTGAGGAGGGPAVVR